MLVCYTAIFSVVMQHSSPQTAAENQTSFLYIIARDKKRDEDMRVISIITKNKLHAHHKTHLPKFR